MESRDIPLLWKQMTAWEAEVAPDESVLLQRHCFQWHLVNLKLLWKSLLCALVTAEQTNTDAFTHVKIFSKRYPLEEARAK